MKKKKKKHFQGFTFEISRQDWIIKLCGKTNLAFFNNFFGNFRKKQALLCIHYNFF